MQEQLWQQRHALVAQPYISPVARKEHCQFTRASGIVNGVDPAEVADVEHRPVEQHEAAIEIIEWGSVWAADQHVLHIRVHCCSSGGIGSFVVNAAWPRWAIIAFA